MADFARGRDVNIQLIQEDSDGNVSVVPVGSPMSATFNMDITGERDDRLGIYESSNEAYLEGESGSLTFKVDSHALHAIQQSIRTATLNKQKTPKFQIIRTIYVPEIASSRSLLYSDVVFTTFSDSAGAKNDAVEISADWTSKIAREI